MFGQVESEVIILHRNKAASARPYAIATALREPLLAELTLSGLVANALSVNAQLAIAQELRQVVHGGNVSVTYYNGSIDVSQPLSACRPYSNKYLVISNGRYVNGLDYNVLHGISAHHKSDITLINCDPKISAGQEKLLLTPGNMLAGVRRFYAPQVKLSPIGIDWPCYVIIKPELMYNIASTLPLEFVKFIEKFSASQITCLTIGAQMLDLECSEDLHAFISMQIALRKQQFQSPVPDSCRVVGSVLIEPDVKIEPNVTILGPSIICSKAHLGRSCVVDRAIVMPRQTIKANEIVRAQIIADGQRAASTASAIKVRAGSNYRLWPWYAYPVLAKRLADIAASLMVLLLFMPVIVIIAALVKLTSHGAAFYGDKRQGLHGKGFRCMKFRSMIAGAHSLQQKLRSLNEVDGPQFKMENDPRVTGIGKFLRNTYLDEIPQFYNVLLGNMSIVGPRPSPEAENSLCASWRDARLSVRPGITGLWQVCRTRKAGADFQEWVYYDRIYVSRVSLRLDIWICWKTALYIIKAFLKQF